MYHRHTYNFDYKSRDSAALPKRPISSKEEAMLLKFKIFYNALLGDEITPQADDLYQNLWTKFENVLIDMTPIKFDSFLSEVRNLPLKLVSPKKEVKTFIPPKKVRISPEKPCKRLTKSLPAIKIADCHKLRKNKSA